MFSNVYGNKIIVNKLGKIEVVDSTKIYFVKQYLNIKNPVHLNHVISLEKRIYSLRLTNFFSINFILSVKLDFKQLKSFIFLSEMFYRCWFMNSVQHLDFGLRKG